MKRHGWEMLRPELLRELSRSRDGGDGEKTMVNNVVGFLATRSCPHGDTVLDVLPRVEQVAEPYPMHVKRWEDGHALGSRDFSQQWHPDVLVAV